MATPDDGAQLAMRKKRSFDSTSFGSQEAMGDLATVSLDSKVIQKIRLAGLVYDKEQITSVPKKQHWTFRIAIQY